VGRVKPMIVQDSAPRGSASDEDLTAEQNAEPSKSQRKREALAMRDLGAALAELGDSQRARIPLPDDVREAVDELNRTPQRSAHKRQLGWLAKRLRQIDAAPIIAALETERQSARSHTQSHHLVEQWRDRLLGLDSQESSGDALTAFLNRYPSADRQQLRQLQRSALAERQNERPPRASRQLFKLLRDLVTASVIDETDDVPDGER